MNPLHVIGLCELRYKNVALPRRKTVFWPNNKLRDDRPGDKTVVTAEQEFQTPLDCRLGVGVPPTELQPGEGGFDYVYNEKGGEWFGIDPLWSSAEAAYIVATIENPSDRIWLQGFAPSPSLPRKFLFNYGPAPVSFGGRDENDEAGEARSDGPIDVQPGEGLRIFWDHIDHCWRPIQRLPFRLEGEGLPLGQIVIQGVPVNIQGHPLVLTPPPPLAARRAAPKPETPATAPPASASLPPVQKPEVVIATIVERPKPLPAAPRALPRAMPEPVELVTTFADGSLVMTPAGDKFRVAELRFPFTLRATSVSGTDFEEIGVLRFDASRFGDVTFAAELEASASTQVAELQLYDLTASAAVVTLSTSSVLTTRVAAVVTLPAALHLYSLRLRRAGGDATKRASCRSAAFEA